MDQPTTPLHPEELLKHAAWLRRLAGTLVVDAARADDVAQQSLLDALARPPARVTHPRAWLATIARNLARAIGRGERRRAEHERLAAASIREPATTEVVARTALHHEVVGAVLALEEPYRTTVLLRFFEDRKPGAIARLTGVPVETVRTRLKRGIELLRGEIVQRRTDANPTRDSRRGGERVLALLGLLEPAERVAVRHALLAKTTVVAGATLGGVASVLSHVGGAVAMSMKAKVAVAAVVIAAATAVFVALRSTRPPELDGASAIRGGVSEPAAVAETSDVAVESATATRLESALGASTIRARVVDDAGAPIAGARVGVVTPAFVLPNRADVPPVAFVEGEVGRSNGSGECAIRLGSEESNRTVDVMALAEGYQPGWWPRARVGDAILLRLRRAGAISGIVRDLEGVPVAGARIRCVVHGPRRFETEAVSGADGRYRLAPYFGPTVRFEEGDHAPGWFAITAEGFAPLHFWSLDNIRETAIGEYRLDPWLVRGATIRGRVVDLGTRAPIAGADVWIRPFDPRVGDMGFHCKSASDGTFVLDHVPAWGVQLVGQHSPDLDRRGLGALCAAARNRGAAHRWLDVPDEAQVLDFELELPALGGVRGRVVDGSGQPIRGVTIRAVNEVGHSARYRTDLGERHEPVKSDEFGRFVLHDLALVNGSGTVARMSGSIDPESDVVYEVSATDVALVERQIVEAPDLIATRAPGFLVHVVDDGGRDVVGAEVGKWIRTESGLKQDDGLNWIGTGVFGRCFVRAPSDFATVARKTFLVVKAVGFVTATRELESEQGEATLALARGHCLSGVVRDVDGAPGTASIHVLPAVEAPEDLADSIRTGELWSATPFDLVLHADTDEGGRFLVRGLDSGPWHVFAVGRRKSSSPLEVAYAADVSDPVGDVEIVLPHSATPALPSGEMPLPPEVCGRVELLLTSAATGRPHLRAGYVSLHSGKQKRDAQEVAPGRYEFETVPAGTWELRIDASDLARETRTLSVIAGQTTQVAVALSSGAIAHGRLSVVELPSFQSATVLLQSDDGGGSGRCEIGSDGAFRVPGLVADKTYRMWVHAEDRNGQVGFWVADEPARSARDAADWTPRLVPAGVLVVRFPYAQRDNFPQEVAIRVVDATGRIVHVVKPVSEYGLERVLSTGDYVVEVDVPGLATQMQPATLRPNSSSVELYFKP